MSSLKEVWSMVVHSQEVFEYTPHSHGFCLHNLDFLVPTGVVLIMYFMFTVIVAIKVSRHEKAFAKSLDARIKDLEECQKGSKR